MNTINIIALTEVASGSVKADAPVYINPAAIATFRPAAYPKAATELRLFGDSELGTIFVRESPERVFELVTGEHLPSLSVDDIKLPAHALSYTGERYGGDGSQEGWKAICACGFTAIDYSTETGAINSLLANHVEQVGLGDLAVKQWKAEGKL